MFVASYKFVPGPPRFHPDHVADLSTSGLNEATVVAAGVYSLEPGRMAKFFGYRGVPNGVESALCFPYGDGTFARIKLFPPAGKMKYAQPPGTGARLYAPFPVETGVLWVCEGEKKTLAARQVGLEAVGIGGVWNWLSKGGPIGDLDLVEWAGREAIVVPDSDAFERPDLMRAVYALGREMQERGAVVSICRLPHGEKKIGLDDFLVAGGDVDALPVEGIGSKTFRSAMWWYRRWITAKILAQV